MPTDDAETISGDLRKYIKILLNVRDMKRNVSRSRWGDFLLGLSEDYYAKLNAADKVYARGIKEVIEEPYE